MKMITLLYAVFLLIAFCLFFLGIKQYTKTKTLLQTGIKTKAKVVELLESRDDDGTTYKHVFEYIDRTQKVITFKSNISTSPPAYNIGDQVNIIYSKNNKTQKVISFWGLFRWTIILFSIASPFLIIGGSYFLYHYGYL